MHRKDKKLCLMCLIKAKSLCQSLIVAYLGCLSTNCKILMRVCVSFPLITDSLVPIKALCQVMEGTYHIFVERLIKDDQMSPEEGGVQVQLELSK